MDTKTVLVLPHSKSILHTYTLTAPVSLRAERAGAAPPSAPPWPSPPPRFLAPAQQGLLSPPPRPRQHWHRLRVRTHAAQRRSCKVKSDQNIWMVDGSEKHGAITWGNNLFVPRHLGPIPARHLDLPSAMAAQRRCMRTRTGTETYGSGRRRHSTPAMQRLHWFGSLLRPDRPRRPMSHRPSPPAPTARAPPPRQGSRPPLPPARRRRRV